MLIERTSGDRIAGKRVAAPPFWRTALLVVALVPGPCLGQAAVPQSLPVQPAPALSETATVTIPALTPVIVEILADLSSKTSKTGQVFPIRLALPILIDGRIVVPSGATGEGEVLDAKHAGWGGAQGILTLFAHDLKVDGRSLRLRSMHVARTGADYSHDLGMVLFVSPALGGVLGLLVSGGDTSVASGSNATARTAEDFSIPIAPPPAAPQALPTEGSTP